MDLFLLLRKTYCRYKNRNCLIVQQVLYWLRSGDVRQCKHNLFIVYKGTYKGGVNNIVLFTVFARRKNYLRSISPQKREKIAYKIFFAIINHFRNKICTIWTSQIIFFNICNVWLIIYLIDNKIYIYDLYMIIDLFFRCMYILIS